jgi:hypothetical protein
MVAPFIMEKFRKYAEQQEKAMLEQLLLLLEHEFKCPTLGRDDEDWRRFLIENKISTSIIIPGNNNELYKHNERSLGAVI